MSDDQQSRLFPGGGDDRLPVLYVATPLSGLPKADQQLLDAWAEAVDSAVLDETHGAETPWGLRLHIPLRISAPWKEDGRDASDIYDLNTAKMWSETDGLIVFSHNGGSIGAGMELVWADSLGIPVLVLCPSDQMVSRQVTGATDHGDITVKSFKDASHLKDVVRQWVTRNRAKLESQEARRSIHQQRLSYLQATLKVAWNVRSESQRERVAAVAGLTSARAARLVEDLDALRVASMDQLLAFTSALKLNLGGAMQPQQRALSTSQLRALSTAAAEEAWTGDQTVDLLLEAQAEMATGAVRRLPLSSPEDWRQFRGSKE